MMRAVCGSNSQSWMPGTEVGIGWNSPRISTGASGFMSQVSSWLGPPRMWRTMAEVGRRFGALGDA